VETVKQGAIEQMAINQVDIPVRSSTPRPAGLRERKKAKTRLALREHALALFSEQGYEKTTVEQIAAAAELSPSTFFRYFPSKEDVVLQDDYGASIIAAFNAQLADTPAVGAFREALRQVLSSMGDEKRAREMERGRLIVSVPELRGGMLAQLSEMTQMVADVLAERVGRDPGDFEIRNFAGVLIGISLSVVLGGERGGEGADYLSLFDRALTHLEAGLPI